MVVAYIYDFNMQFSSSKASRVHAVVENLEKSWNLHMISRPREVTEIFIISKSHEKWKYTVAKMTFWPNTKCDIPGDILMY